METVSLGSRDPDDWGLFLSNCPFLYPTSFSRWQLLRGGVNERVGARSLLAWGARPVTSQCARPLSIFRRKCPIRPNTCRDPPAPISYYWPYVRLKKSAPRLVSPRLVSVASSCPSPGTMLFRGIVT